VRVLVVLELAVGGSSGVGRRTRVELIAKKSSSGEKIQVLFLAISSTTDI
jgi:hypothetical protein